MCIYIFLTFLKTGHSVPSPWGPPVLLERQIYTEVAHIASILGVTNYADGVDLTQRFCLSSIVGRPDLSTPLCPFERSILPRPCPLYILSHHVELETPKSRTAIIIALWMMRAGRHLWPRHARVFLPPTFPHPNCAASLHVSDLRSYLLHCIIMTDGSHLNCFSDSQETMPNSLDL